MSSVELSKMLRKTLSQTLSSELEFCPQLKSIKRWCDSLTPPLSTATLHLLKMYVEVWYGRTIYLHMKPIYEQVKIVRDIHGTKHLKPSNPDRATNYVWEGDGDWHH